MRTGALTIFSALVVLSASLHPAGAASLSLPPVAVGTIGDWGVMGPPDGKPERITSTTEAIVQEFNPRLRGIVEFSLSEVSGPVTRATLTFTQGPDAEGKDALISVSFYEGNGAINLEDYGLPAKLAGTFTSPATKGPVAHTLDVTAAVQQAVQAGYRFIGFRFESGIPEKRSFSFGDLSPFRLGTGRLDVEVAPRR